MMADPSKDQPTGGRDWSKSAHPDRRCTAHKKTGERCKNAARAAQTVCGYHGGSAPQTVAKAKRRLEAAADRLTERLIGLAENDLKDGTKVGAYVQFGAVTAALDRAGVVEQKQLSVEVAAKPFEEVFSALVGGSRSDYRRENGIADPDPLPAPEPRSSLDVLDVEVVPDHDDTEVSDAGVGDDEQVSTESLKQSLGDSDERALLPPNGYLNAETALAQVRESNRNSHKTRRR